MAGRSRTEKKTIVWTGIMIRALVGSLIIFLFTGIMSAGAGASQADSAQTDTAVQGAVETVSEQPEEEGLSEDREEEEEQDELSDYSYSDNVTTIAPKNEDSFKVSANDPRVIRLAKNQTPENGELVFGKKKTFWRLKNGKRLKNSWVWYKGNAYYMGAKGYAFTGMHTYKGFLYYFDSKGRLAVNSFFSYKGKHYYACETGALVTGAWKKVKGYHRYFYNDGRMAVSTRIQGLQVDAKGRLNYDEGSECVETGTFKAENKKQRLIIIGASRVVQMAKAVKTDKKVIYIARSGKGYSWLVSTAIPRLNRYLKQYPRSKVVIQLGNNDIKKKTPDGRINDYIWTYKKLIRKWNKADFYFMDILPPGKIKSQKKADAMLAFNDMLAEVFPRQYIGGWSYMTNNGFRCSYNECHYSNNTSRDIFNFILRKIR